MPYFFNNINTQWLHTNGDNGVNNNNNNRNFPNKILKLLA